MLVHITINGYWKKEIFRIKKTWLAPSLQAPVVALVALMLQKVYNKKLYFLTVQKMLVSILEGKLIYSWIFCILFSIISSANFESAIVSTREFVISSTVSFRRLSLIISKFCKSFSLSLHDIILDIIIHPQIFMTIFYYIISKLAMCFISQAVHNRFGSESGVQSTLIRNSFGKEKL